MPRDPYAVLGVDPSAGDAEVQAAYRARSMLLHPDLHEGRPDAVRREAQRAMAQLTEAYETVVRQRAGAGAPAPPPLVRRLGRMVGRSQAGRAAAEAADRDGDVAFRLGWLVGRRRRG